MNAGDCVRTRGQLMGFARRPCSEHSHGAARDIPPGFPCQILLVGRATGWMTIHCDLDSGESLETYRIEAITGPEMLVAPERLELRLMIPKGTPQQP